MKIFESILTILAIGIVYGLFSAISDAFVTEGWRFFSGYLTGLLILFGLYTYKERENKKVKKEI